MILKISAWGWGFWLVWLFFSYGCFTKDIKPIRKMDGMIFSIMMALVEIVGGF